MNKLKDWVSRLKKGHMLSVILNKIKKEKKFS